VPALQLRHEGQDVAAAEGGRQIELEQAARRRVERRHRGPGLFEVVQHQPRPVAEPVARLGELKPPRRAAEQRGAEVVLQRLHGARHGGHLAPLQRGGARKAARVGGAQEQAQGGEVVHGAPGRRQDPTLRDSEGGAKQDRAGFPASSRAARGAGAPRCRPAIPPRAEPGRPARA
jgi:hypothetical protein